MYLNNKGFALFQLWKNCFEFWLGLQEYHELYYSEVIDPYSLQVKAKVLSLNFGMYIICTYKLSMVFKRHILLKGVQYHAFSLKNNNLNIFLIKIAEKYQQSI